MSTIRTYLDILDENNQINEDQNSADRLAEDALNVAVKHIQDNLGITTGDHAGMFFSDDAKNNAVLNTLKEYIMSELRSRQH